MPDTRTPDTTEPLLSEIPSKKLTLAQLLTAVSARKVVAQDENGVIFAVELVDQGPATSQGSSVSTHHM